MCTSCSLWELTFWRELCEIRYRSVAGAEFFVKVAVECVHYSLDVFAAHVLPTNKSTLFMFIITSIPYIVLKTFFLMLRMVLYKKTIVCVLD